MFTILSVVLYIWILGNNNLSNDSVAMLLAFGWILFIGAGLILDGVAVSLVMLLILLIVTGIIVLSCSIAKNKRVKAEKIGNNEETAEESDGGI